MNTNSIFLIIYLANTKCWPVLLAKISQLFANMYLDLLLNIELLATHVCNTLIDIFAKIGYS
jgi:hypothetical protein